MILCISDINTVSGGLVLNARFGTHPLAVAGCVKEERTMKSVSAPISLAGSQLGETRHVCAFFNNDEEEYRVLLPFI